MIQKQVKKNMVKKIMHKWERRQRPLYSSQSNANTRA